MASFFVTDNKHPIVRISMMHKRIMGKTSATDVWMFD